MYVSTSALDPECTANATDDIVRLALVRNASLGVTGALISTGKHFAQVLEGSPEHVDELMHSIRGDERHSKLTVVDRREIMQRRFARWLLAFEGSARYVDGPIESLLSIEGDLDRRQSVERIYGIMIEFAKA